MVCLRKNAESSILSDFESNGIWNIRANSSPHWAKTKKCYRAAKKKQVRKKAYLWSYFLSIFPNRTESLSICVVVVKLHECDLIHCSIKIASISTIGIAFVGNQALGYSYWKKKKLIALKAYTQFVQRTQMWRMHTL